MAKSTQDNSPIQADLYKLEKEIAVCKKFISLTSYKSITIIFSGRIHGYDETDIVKIDNPDFALVPIKELFDFFNTYAANLTAKKLFIENGIESNLADSFIGGMEALRQSLKKNFK